VEKQGKLFNRLLFSGEREKNVSPFFKQLDVVRFQINLFNLK